MLILTAFGELGTVTAGELKARMMTVLESGGKTDVGGEFDYVMRKKQGGEAWVLGPRTALTQALFQKASE